MSNLGITQVAANQDQKEVTINDADARIEAALTETFDADVAAGNVTVTADQYQTALQIRAINATVSGRTVTLPAVKRIVLLTNDADSTTSVDFVRGATALTVAPGVSALTSTDGTADGLIVLLRGSEAGSLTSADIADFNSAVDARIAATGGAIPFRWPVAVGDETTAITAGAAKLTFRWPFPNTTLTGITASLNTASSSGAPTFDVNEEGVSILSTKLTVDAGEKTSVTAATAPVLSDTSLAYDAEITVDIDASGTGAKGPKLTFIGTWHE